MLAGAGGATDADAGGGGATLAGVGGGGATLAVAGATDAAVSETTATAGLGGGAVLRTVGRGTGGLLLGALMTDDTSNDRSAPEPGARLVHARAFHDGSSPVPTTNTRARRDSVDQGSRN